MKIAIAVIITAIRDAINTFTKLKGFNDSRIPQKLARFRVRKRVNIYNVIPKNVSDIFTLQAIFCVRKVYSLQIKNK